MYFKSRVEAGQKLAEKIVQKYQGQPCAVVGLSDGGVMVGAQISLKLNCVLTMLVSDTIDLPRENVALAGISQEGSITFNPVYSSGQIDEMTGEYRGYIEQAKIQKIREMHKAASGSPLIRKNLLRDKVVILVADGLSSGFLLDIAADYLKPIHIKGLVVATPLATVQAVDRMHVLANDVFCLSVVDNFINTEHYYDVHDIPSHELVVKTVEQVVANWQG